MDCRPSYALVLAVALFVAAPAPATANPPKTPFEEAVAHFKAGEYARAAPAFHIAYSRDSKPVLLFNAALSEQRSNQLELAQRDYKRVLARTDLHPKIAERARAGLAAVEAALAAAAGTGASTPPRPKPVVVVPAPTTKPAPEQPVAGAARPPGASAKPGAAGPDPVIAESAPGGGWHKPVGWAAVGVGGVLVGVGGWLLASWSADEAEFNEGLTRKDGDGGKVSNISREAYQARWNELGAQRNGALATTLTGVAAAGAGAWLLWSAPEDKAVTVLPVGRGFALRLAF